MFGHGSLNSRLLIMLPAAWVHVLPAWAAENLRLISTPQDVDKIMAPKPFQGYGIQKPFAVQVGFKGLGVRA